MNGAAVMPNPATLNSAVVSVLTAEYLSTQQVADILGVSKWTLAFYRAQRQGPPFVLFARGCIRYSRLALESWLKERVHTEGKRIAARGR